MTAARVNSASESSRLDPTLQTYLSVFQGIGLPSTEEWLEEGYSP